MAALPRGFFFRGWLWFVMCWYLGGLRCWFRCWHLGGPRFRNIWYWCCRGSRFRCWCLCGLRFRNIWCWCCRGSRFRCWHLSGLRFRNIWCWRWSRSRFWYRLRRRGCGQYFPIVCVQNRGILVRNAAGLFYYTGKPPKQSNKKVLQRRAALTKFSG